MSLFAPLLTALMLLLTPLAWAADDQGQQGAGQQTTSGEQTGQGQGEAKTKKKSAGAEGDPEPECD